MIQINFLAHNSRRLKFSEYSLHILKKIKNKTKIKLVIHYSNDERFWEEFASNMNVSGVKTLIDYTKVGDYMSKIKKSIISECEYSCSMDDDIMINEYVWDFIIENIDILQDENNLFISPLISNGIPSVELFIRDFCNIEEKNKLYEVFQETHINNNWGVNYSSLNDSELKNEWNPDLFYSLVDKINHYYKGIHPVRLSFEAQQILSDIIINNEEKFFSEQDYKIEIINRPYFCNSFYFIKTDVWKKIINNQNLYRDPFDEVPLNIYKDMNNLNMVFIKNGYCVHMAYNTITEAKQEIIEMKYIEKLINIK